MFFNIIGHKPDSCVFDFVKEYFPAFTKPYKPGGWTMYPPGPIPKLEYTVHSLRFARHPYFDARFREGRLDILASEIKGTGHPGPIDFQLWFMFDNKTDAQYAFNKLSNMFDSVSKSKKIFQRNGRTVAEYSDQTTLDDSNSVQFILTEDELLDNKYKLFFRLGSITYTKSYNEIQH